jgi:hypothetical protein
MRTTTGNHTGRLGAYGAGIVAAITAWALALVALMLTAGGALAQGAPPETTDGTPGGTTALEETAPPETTGATTVPEETGIPEENTTEEGPAPPGDEPAPKGKGDGKGGLRLGGISITDDCTKVGSIKIGDCGGGGGEPEDEGDLPPEAETPPTDTPRGTANQPGGDPMTQECITEGEQYASQPPVAVASALDVAAAKDAEQPPEEAAKQPEAPIASETTAPETTGATVPAESPQVETAPPEGGTTTLPNEATTATPGGTTGLAEEPPAEETPEGGQTVAPEETDGQPEDEEPLETTGMTGTEPTPEKCEQLLQERNTQTIAPEETDGRPQGEEQYESTQEEEPAPLPEEQDTPEEPVTVAPEDTTGQPEGEDQYRVPETEAPESGTTEPEPPVEPESTEGATPPKAIESTGPVTTEISAPAEDVCPGAEEIEASSGGVGNQYTDPFEIKGEKFVLAYKATTADTSDEGGNLVVDLTDAETGMTVETIRAEEEGANSTPLELGPGSYALNVYADNRNWETKAYDCAGPASAPTGDPAPKEAPVPPAPDAGEEPAPEEAPAPAPEPQQETTAAPEAPEPQEEPPVAETPEEPSPATEGEAQEEPAPSDGEGFGLEPAPEEKANAGAVPPPLAMTPTAVKMTSTKAQMPTKETANGAVAVLPETGGPGAGILPWLFPAALGGATGISLGLLYHSRRGPFARTPIPATPPSRRRRG